MAVVDYLSDSPLVHSHPLKLLAFGFVFATLVYFAIASRKPNATSLPDVPWVGRNEKLWFANMRCRFWTMMNYEAALTEAYEKFAKADKSCILATLDGEVILLPPSAIPWMISQPPSILSVNESTKHILQTRYSFPYPQIMDPTVHFEVIKNELTRQVFNVTPEVSDEMAAAVSDIFGNNSEEWTEIPLFESLIQIIGRTSNRVFVGLPLCRDEAYLHNAIGFAEDVALCATVLRLFPPAVRAVVAPIVTYPNRKHTRAYTRILTPEILRRQQAQANIDAEKAKDAPNDFLQWLITRSKTSSHAIDPSEADPRMICARLLHTNFASVHTTGFIATNVLFDLISTPPASGVQEKIRAEALSCLDPETKTWTRAGLGRMHHLDSVLRESSRRASIIGVGVNHAVTAPDGVRSPDGTFCPRGSLVACHSWGLHHDPAIYPGPEEFKPFRFSEAREALPDHADLSGAEREKAYLDEKKVDFVSTSEKFLGFGHGRHACPGRFFANNELKLLVGYVLCNYDVELPVGKDGAAPSGRPENWWAGPNHVPPMGEKIRVRRRKAE